MILGPLRRAKQRISGRRHARTLLAGAPRKRIVVGAGGVCPPGWVPTEHVFLDLLVPRDWERLVAPGSLDAILAEHVWEHLGADQGLHAARQCFLYLRPGGYLRAAVPDGLHPDPRYIDAVRVGGSGAGADEHRVLYTYATLAEVFRAAGFQVSLREHFDEAGRFHFEDWDPRDGMVWRSLRYDERNRDGRPNYTSIVLDAVKPCS
jgi:predicted SAM-dependent methyltransferase